MTHSSSNSKSKELRASFPIEEANEIEKTAKELGIRSNELIRRYCRDSRSTSLEEFRDAIQQSVQAEIYPIQASLSQLQSSQTDLTTTIGLLKVELDQIQAELQSFNSHRDESEQELPSEQVLSQTSLERISRLLEELLTKPVNRINAQLDHHYKCELNRWFVMKVQAEVSHLLGTHLVLTLAPDEEQKALVEQITQFNYRLEQMEKWVPSLPDYFQDAQSPTLPL